MADSRDDRNDVRFAGSIPAIYEQYLVPLLFEPYANDLAVRVKALGPKTILETTAGSGALTRALAKAMPDAKIRSTDLNDAMLDVAKQSLPNVTFAQADAQELPFGDREFDVVVSQFGMMFPPDRIAAYREARRVLVPSGRFLFSVWGPLAANPLSEFISDALGAQFPNDPPRFFVRMPFAYHDHARIEADLRQGGFTDIRVEDVDIETHAPSAESAAIGMCQGCPLRGEIEERAPGRLDDVTAKVTEAVVKRYGKGAVPNPMRAVVVSAGSASS